MTLEAPFSHVAPKERSLWPAREAVERLVGLQDQTVDLLQVLPNHQANHFHFGDSDKIGERPLPLQPFILAVQAEPFSDQRHIDMRAAYAEHLERIGFSGRAEVYSFKDGTFGEDIYENKSNFGVSRFGAERIVEHFPMVDFWIDFDLLDIVKKQRAMYGFSDASWQKPGLFINATRVEGSKSLYQIDLATNGGDVRTVDRLHEHLNIHVPWFRFYEELGIQEHFDALIFPKKHQQLVSDLHSAKVSSTAA